MAPVTDQPNIQSKLKATLKDSPGIFLIREILIPGASMMTLRFGLAELAQEGFIIRLARGVYYRPPVVEGSFKRVFPTPDEVAFAVARKSSNQIIPCMEHSAYLCGLDKGAFKPLSWLTDGTSRKLKLYKGPELEFTHTKEARLFTFVSDRMRNLSNGLRHVGRDNITEREERIVREAVAEIPRKDLMEDLPKCPEWVRDLIMGVA